ncbi:MAG: 4-alpha-glucanotransferase [Spirochaetaceae bacterium]|jgi:4-alpha-glucanotransferase|nr:4-alpha-glucanotransferase [Spirochaetaceae bacterium]
MSIDFTKRRVGAAVPLGALRGKDSVGVGEYPDLAEFAGLCAKSGVTLIQLLPVNDTGYESSPYSSISAFALNPLYIKIGAIPEAAAFRAEIDALGKRFEKYERFDYYEITGAKIRLLRAIFDANKEAIVLSAAPAGVLGTWIGHNGWVKGYAVYRRLKDANGQRGWKDWNKADRNGGGTSVEAAWADPAFREDHLFWAWLQVIADQQFSAAAKAVADAGILLEGDIPILMNEDSADVWEYPEIFNRDLSAGAPPDMYAPDGQNWGFPTYNWEHQEEDGYAWWKKRLETASKYYNAYRIDHVLGFFRIWASSCADVGAKLGRFIPYIPVKTADLTKLKFDEGRIRWLSRPHIRTDEVWDAVGGSREEAQRILDTVLDRIGSEELWLFKDCIHGEKDIAALPISSHARDCLLHAWSDRLFLEYRRGAYFPTWSYRETRAWASLSDDEKAGLEALLRERDKRSELLWEQEGRKLLETLTRSTTMLACAEDLGAVPDCVPKTLAALNILGLRVVRWTRQWEQGGQPYIPFEDYPELSVCTPAVHDSSTLREWWDTEADQNAFVAFIGAPSLPRVYNPGTARTLLRKVAGAASRFRVFQIQDLLHLSSRWYANDPSTERVNIPGTYSAFNWTWRLPAPIATLAQDDEFLNGVRELAAIQPTGKAAQGTGN